MKMLTAPIIRQLKKTGNTDGTEVSPVIVKFFQPWGSWTWYAVDGVELPDGDWEFFGLVEGLETELGYFRLSELMSVTGPGGLKIERDLHFHGYVLDKNTNVVRRADKGA
jgi:hypothetical protein